VALPRKEMQPALAALPIAPELATKLDPQAWADQPGALTRRRVALAARMLAVREQPDKAARQRALRASRALRVFQAREQLACLP